LTQFLIVYSLLERQSRTIQFYKHKKFSTQRTHSNGNPENKTVSLKKVGGDQQFVVMTQLRGNSDCVWGW